MVVGNIHTISRISTTRVNYAYAGVLPSGRDYEYSAYNVFGRYGYNDPGQMTSIHSYTATADTNIAQFAYLYDFRVFFLAIVFFAVKMQLLC